MCCPSTNVHHPMLVDSKNTPTSIHGKQLLCRCNPADMLSGLPCIIAVLLENGYSLQALPAIALLEWLAQHVCGSLPATVAVRLQRVQALTQLGLLAQAATVLGLLLLVCSQPPLLFCHAHSCLLAVKPVHGICQPKTWLALACDSATLQIYAFLKLLVPETSIKPSLLCTTLRSRQH